MRFKITWKESAGCAISHGEYKVSIPNFEGAEVVTVESLLSDEVVDKIAAVVYRTSLDVISTLRPERREEYTSAIRDNVRAAISDALPEPS